MNCHPDVLLLQGGIVDQLGIVDRFIEFIGLFLRRRNPRDSGGRGQQEEVAKVGCKGSIAVIGGGVILGHVHFVQLFILSKFILIVVVDAGIGEEISEAAGEPVRELHEQDLAAGTKFNTKVFG